MIYSTEVKNMCPVTKGAYHGPAPIPEEGEWVQVKEIKDISGLTHGVGWCAPQQGACKLTLNVKDGIGNTAGKDSFGSAQYGSGLRCYQRCHAPVVPPDRVWPQPDGFF